MCYRWWNSIIQNVSLVLQIARCKLKMCTEEKKQEIVIDTLSKGRNQIIGIGEWKKCQASDSNAICRWTWNDNSCQFATTMTAFIVYSILYVNDMLFGAKIELNLPENWLTGSFKMDSVAHFTFISHSFMQNAIISLNQFSV